MTMVSKDTTMPTAIIRQKQKLSLTRWFKRALTVVAALILLLVVGLFVLAAHETAQIARFYDAHPMLRMMNKFSTSQDPRMVDVLLERVPIGSTRSNAVQTLSSEGMFCTKLTVEDRKLLSCELKEREACLLIPEWYIQVSLDDNDEISGGRVNAGKATCPLKRLS
jgi:hypothetical protein